MRADPGHLPSVREFASYLAKSYNCCRVLRTGFSWLSRAQRLGLKAGLRRSLLLCGPAVSPALLRDLRELLEVAPAAVVTGRCWDWTPGGFRELIESAGLEVMFCGETDGRELVSVVRKPQPVAPTPKDFRVVAFAGAYNEEDVIASFLEHTIAQGVEVCLLDNWSTDRTVERAEPFLGRGLISILKFPENGPSAHHEWWKMLARKAELAAQTEADWFIHIDPDEIRESPWPGVSLRDALYRVDREGFNAVDHTCITFHPTGGVCREDQALAAQFGHFDFPARPGDDQQVKAWKRQPGPVDCAHRGGHDVRFPGRRVYPFKFLLRHYPIRSQEHGERKVLRERQPRFSPALREMGWHKQYDGVGPQHA